MRVSSPAEDAKGEMSGLSRVTLKSIFAFEEEAHGREVTIH